MVLPNNVNSGHSGTLHIQSSCTCLSEMHTGELLETEYPPELVTKCFMGEQGCKGDEASVQMIIMLVSLSQVVKMRSNLERFQVTKLCPFQEKLQKQYLSTNVRRKFLFHYMGAC